LRAARSRHAKRRHSAHRLAALLTVATGSRHATPRGTFQVSWKAGPNYASNICNEPMPWAVFFAPGGIAFHGGNEHLPVGAEVVVF